MITFMEMSLLEEESRTPSVSCCCSSVHHPHPRGCASLPHQALLTPARCLAIRLLSPLDASSPALVCWHKCCPGSCSPCTQSWESSGEPGPVGLLYRSTMASDWRTADQLRL